MSEADLSHPRQDVVRSAGIVSAAVLLSRLTGLAREITMARLFGAGIAKDAFDLGFRIPNLTRDLFAEGALSSAFVPTFTRYLTQHGRAEAAHLSNLVATALILVVGAITVLGILLAGPLVALLASGFQQVPGKFDLAVGLTQVMFPFLLLVALAAQAMGVLNANQQFGIPALASTFFNVGSLAVGVAGALWVAPRLGLEPIYGMAVGVVVGGALQWFCQVPSLVRSGFRFRPAFDFGHPGLRQIARLMGPAILGSAAVQINVMVNTHYAAGITNEAGQVINGPVSWLSYAFRFMQLPLGLFGVAIASATLPAVSRSAAERDLAKFRDLLARSLGMVFLLTVPSAVGLAVLGESIVGLIYEGGPFTPYDTRQTAVALAWYAVGLAGYSAVKVLAPAFYALGDSQTPMVVSLLSILINFAAAATLVKAAGFGHGGLALATSLVAMFNFLVLLWRIRRPIGGVYGRALLASVSKIGAASAIMGVASWWLSGTIAAELGRGRLARAVELGVAIPAGIAVFYGAARLFRVSEVEAAWNSLGRPLLRKLGLRG